MRGNSPAHYPLVRVAATRDPLLHFLGKRCRFSFGSDIHSRMDYSTRLVRPWCTCRRTADRAHAADLHACAEPFDDPAWLFELKLDAESFGRGMEENPTSSTLPNISLQFAVAQACVRPPFSTWTLSGPRTNSDGSRGGNYPGRYFLAQPGHRNLRPGSRRGWWRRSILGTALIVLAGVPPTSSSTPRGTELGRNPA